MAVGLIVETSILKVQCRPIILQYPRPSGSRQDRSRISITSPCACECAAGDRTLTLTLYNTTAQTDIIRLDDDPIISRLDWQQVAPTQVQYTFNLKSQQQWGYKLKRRYKLGAVFASSTPQPLAGIKILLDPGHGGAELVLGTDWVLRKILIW